MLIEALGSYLHKFMSKKIGQICGACITGGNPDAAIECNLGSPTKHICKLTSAMAASGSFFYILMRTASSSSNYPKIQCIIDKVCYNTI